MTFCSYLWTKDLIWQEIVKWLNVAGMGVFFIESHMVISFSCAKVLFE